MAIEPQILNELRSKLEEEKERLEKGLSRIGTPTGTPGDYKTRYNEIGPDEEENASEVEEYSDNLALEDNLERQLKEVNEALERIKQGTYGVCANCGQPIDPERLRAYPAAKVCVKCSH